MYLWLIASPKRSEIFKTKKTLESFCNLLTIFVNSVDYNE